MCFNFQDISERNLNITNNFKTMKKTDKIEFDKITTYVHYANEAFKVYQ